MTRCLLSARPDVLGLHPTGGVTADRSLERLLDLLQDKSFVAKLDSLRAKGTKIEVECHALGWLIPRDLFQSRPDWFRMNEQGTRTPDSNICVSNPDVLMYLRQRSRQLAALLPSDTNRYYFWIDDIKDGFCRCPKCRGITPSDQAMIMYRAMLDGIRSFNPKATLSYLAYNETMALPSKQNHDGLFLEFAPIERNTLLPITHAANVSLTASLKSMLAYFGTGDAKVLEYWMDNSLFSHWKKPPVRLEADFDVVRQDVEYYLKQGFEHIATFACFLSDDYAELYGAPPLSEYINTVQNTIK